MIQSRIIILGKMGEEKEIEKFDMNNPIKTGFMLGIGFILSILLLGLFMSILLLFMSVLGIMMNI